MIFITTYFIDISRYFYLYTRLHIRFQYHTYKFIALFLRQHIRDGVGHNLVNSGAPEVGFPLHRVVQFNRDSTSKWLVTQPGTRYLSYTFMYVHKYSYVKSDVLLTHSLCYILP
jgi:hypothetical protein